MQELVNHHDTIREMLGHGTLGTEQYPFQTLKGNVMLLTPELLDKINQIVVPAEQQRKNAVLIANAHQEYLDVAKRYLQSAD